MSVVALKNIKGVALDMDGTLIDCEPINRMVVQKATGVDIKIDWSRCAGKKEEIILDWMKETHGAEKIRIATHDFLVACKRGYADAMTSLRPREGIVYLLNTFAELNIPMIVVTNTEKNIAIEKLKHCGLLGYMQDVIGSDTITERGLQPKPSGDGYKEAARVLGIPTEHMIGFEDSTTGMTALAETNAISVQIIDNGTPAHKSADVIIDGDSETDLILLNNEIRRQNNLSLYMPSLSPEPRRAAYT